VIQDSVQVFLLLAELIHRRNIEFSAIEQASGMCSDGCRTGSVLEPSVMQGTVVMDATGRQERERERGGAQRHASAP